MIDPTNSEIKNDNIASQPEPEDTNLLKNPELSGESSVAGESKSKEFKEFLLNNTAILLLILTLVVVSVSGFGILFLAGSQPTGSTVPPQPAEENTPEVVAGSENELSIEGVLGEIYAGKIKYSGITTNSGGQLEAHINLETEIDSPATGYRNAFESCRALVKELNT